MGLSFFGRRSDQSKAALAHLAGAAAGGAGVGLVLGLIGKQLVVGAGRVAFLACLAGYALYLASRRKNGIGLRRQVPRNLLGKWRIAPTYAAWGALLGLGVVTLIPYSAYLVLLGGESVAGPVLGTAAGALFGLTREAVALLPLVRRATAAEISGVLPTFVRPGAILNVAVIITATGALMKGL